eukprot:Sspe_Gene.22795::Locus_8738_Transcript_1_1_Confidence_1.000_Length_1425::g.22795::m.22795
MSGKAKKEKKKKRGDAPPTVAQQPQRVVERPPEYSIKEYGPPSNAELLRLPQDELIKRILKERQERIQLEVERDSVRKSRDVLEQHHRSMRKEIRAIEEKLQEVELEFQQLEVQKEVNRKQKELEYGAIKDGFANHVIELEQKLDQEKNQRYLESCELQENEVIALNTHLVAEGERNFEIEALRRKLIRSLEHLNALKLAYVRRDKVVQQQQQRIDTLRKQLHDAREAARQEASVPGLQTTPQPPIPKSPSGDLRKSTRATVSDRPTPSQPPSPYIPPSPPTAAVHAQPQDAHTPTHRPKANPAHDAMKDLHKAIFSSDRYAVVPPGDVASAEAVPPSRRKPPRRSPFRDVMDFLWKKR